MSILVLTFATTGTNRHSFATLEKIGIDNCVMDLGFKDIKEAFLTDLLASLWALDHGPILGT